MLYQIRTWGVTLIGVLIGGMLIGSWLAGSSVLWWLMIVLGAIAFGGGVILAVLDKSKASRQEPLARV